MSSRSDRPLVTSLVWVRHGQADSNRDGRFGGHSAAALTALGHRQAAATAEAVAKLAPTAIVSSDLTRAEQTAEPIARITGLPLTFDRGLRERSLGIFDGLSFVEAEEKYPELWAKLMAREPDAVPEGGETEDMVFARVAQAIEAAVETHPGGRVVVVSHGLALFHAFSHVCGLGSPSAGHAVFMLVDNCSVSRIDRRHGPDTKRRWRILSINDTAHLRDLPDDSAAQ